MGRDPGRERECAASAPITTLMLLFSGGGGDGTRCWFCGRGAMGILLALHLGVILALFLVLPYSKFVHGIYRSAALLRNAAEREAG